MADDSVQQGTDTIATDHVTSLNGAAVTQSSTSPKVQRVKVGYGDDGTFRDASEAFPLPVRDRQDANRQAVSLLVDNVAGIATEALVSYGGFNNGTALTAGTAAFVVPAGRVFRVTNATLSATGTAAGTIRARLRAATTVAATSPHVVSLAATHPASVGMIDSRFFGDGLEIAAGQQVGISVVGLTTQTYTVNIVGFTYVP